MGNRDNGFGGISKNVFVVADVRIQPNQVVQGGTVVSFPQGNTIRKMHAVALLK